MALKDWMQAWYRFRSMLPISSLHNDSPTGYRRGADHPRQTGEDEKMRILFVDDEKILVEMSVERFSRMGHDVTGSSSSLEALSLFKASPHEFDLVITDYTMPFMTGLDLAKKMVAIRSDIPIIMLSGFDETVNRAEIEEAGVRVYAPKTVNRQEMVELIKQALRGDRLHGVCDLGGYCFSMI